MVNKPGMIENLIDGWLRIAQRDAKRTFMATIISTSASVTAFAAIIGASRRTNPYTTHKEIPAAKLTSMPQEMSSQRRVRQALSTCGTKEIVVSVPATNPSSEMSGIQPFLFVAHAANNFIASPDPSIFQSELASSSPRVVPASGGRWTLPGPVGCSPDEQIPRPPRDRERPKGRPNILRYSAARRVSSVCQPP